MVNLNLLKHKNYLSPYKGVICMITYKQLSLVATCSDFKYKYENHK